MAQLTIYLPDAVEKHVRRAARRARVSVSAYLAGLAAPNASTGAAKERAHHLTELAGSWRGTFPAIDDPPPEEP